MEGAGPPRIDERRDAGGGDVDDECNEPPLPTPTSLLEGRGGKVCRPGGSSSAHANTLHAKFDFHRFESKFYFIFDAVFFPLSPFLHFFPPLSSSTLLDSMLESIVEEFGID